MNKVLYFDVETTGTDAFKHDIVQLSGIVEIDGKVAHEFNINMQPRNWETIEPKALEVTGLTLETLKTYQSAEDGFAEFELIVAGRNHPWAVNRYDKYDKFTPAGYNVGFDLQFLDQFFRKSGESYGSGWMQNWRAIDGLPIVRFLEHCGCLPKMSDQKLGTLCNHFGIEIEAHDALSDIKATRNLLLKLREYLALQPGE